MRWSATVLIVVAAAGTSVPNIDEVVAAVLTQPEPQAAPRHPREASAADPRRSETALSRARALAAAGRLHDALQALDGVRPTDADRPTPTGSAPTSSGNCSLWTAPRPMKCPKCGYLGFDDVDRCRNCGYDFALVPAPDPELEIRLGEPPPAALDDLALIDAGGRRRNDGAHAPTPC